MKIEKIYRLVYVSDDSKDCKSSFFTDKKSAINYLEDMKDDISKLYEEYDNCEHPFGAGIHLQEIILDEVEDIDFFANTEKISEWVFDEDFTRAYQKDMAKAGICTEETFGMWKDYEVE